MRQASDNEPWGFASATSVPDGGIAVAWAVAIKRDAAQGEPHLRWLPHPIFPCPAEGLGAGEVAIWLAAVSGGQDDNAGTSEPTALNLERSATILDAQERERLARFRHIDDRCSYLAAHAGTRFILASIVDRSPDALQFRPSQHGKPMLLDSPMEIDFSLSHARGVVAVTASRMAVGVDVEPLRDITHLKSMSELVLSEDEQSVVRQVPKATRSQLFLRYWTLKEALLKAAALGFSIAPNALTVDAGPAPTVLSVPSELGPAAQWQLSAGVTRLMHRQ
ncbi:4'-phosphopantetheinyl transferase superfamily protein [Bradyrhizobium sp. LHD-71]|uniref:4'-phosphopantetheinyl transferase family protein n=1 Tax=Bradyrhizobium sp. LHD-71 TaxID=3072141 RepID=UPI00280C8AAC|nr:4'-phosphopantetheinyl transferase superfamily protein [Bradyrhizobium sp. LHD-71]MDQ8728106.1 4'-phosphopantetheinyl transferase superfamily protein [Bradyrhizobium sp. LHD-71]